MRNRDAIAARQTLIEQAVQSFAHFSVLHLSVDRKFRRKMAGRKMLKFVNVTDTRDAVQDQCRSN
jgi:hypothetical protein